MKPIEHITTTSGKTILNHGQDLAGYLRIKNVRGTARHKIILTYAEVPEHNELGSRLLRE